MTAAADLVLTNAEVHTLATPDATHGAVAVRDGAIVRLGDAWEVGHLAGVETEVIDLEGRPVLPGFVDAHTHLTMLGQYLVHADLRGADGPDECVERLRKAAAEGDGWVLGFGFDESGWADPRYLDRDDLDAVADSRPVVAFREDMHVAGVNSVALDRHLEAMPEDDVRTEAGEPTGVLVEEAIDVVYRAIEPGRAESEELLRAAQAEANRLGVTAVHDMVRRSYAPEVYRALDRAGELTLRVRLNYWSDHLDAVREAGLATNDGSSMVRVGAIKTYTDGSLGGRTAKLHEPYADGEGTGQWVVDPDELEALVERADGAGLQLAAHAIGDAAVDAVLEAYADTDDPAGARHRVEHAELTSDAAVERFAELGAVASVQPNFLKWARPGGLYEQRLGPERGAATNRYRDLLDAGVPLAFGSDGMPLDPLFGVHQAVNHPTEDQALTVTEALRAYTRGGAYAGFDEGRLGTVAVGKRADLVALDGSPWDRPEAIEDLEVALTVVDGDVVFDAR
ncbi:MAG: amidohydrolase [Halobacteriales archaeon]|nr:amidohydrolase [Halobacteriales archaeon]